MKCKPKFQLNNSLHGSSIRVRAPLLPINQLVPRDKHCLNRSGRRWDRFHGSGMEGFLSTFPPYNVCGNPASAPPAQDNSCGKREGRFITPQGLNYLELCKAIISQVSPGLPPPLKRANTQECGVQVNAKVDKIVQCSLGPKTLFCLEGDHHVCSKSPKSPEMLSPDGNAPCKTQPVSNLRFLRPVSIYSPVLDRKIHLKKPCDDGRSEGEDEAAQAESDKDAETHQTGEDTAAEWMIFFLCQIQRVETELRAHFFPFPHCLAQSQSLSLWTLSPSLCHACVLCSPL